MSIVCSLAQGGCCVADRACRMLVSAVEVLTSWNAVGCIRVRLTTCGETTSNLACLFVSPTACTETGTGDTNTSVHLHHNSGCRTLTWHTTDQLGGKGTKRHGDRHGDRHFLVDTRASPPNRERTSAGLSAQQRLSTVDTIPAYVPVCSGRTSTDGTLHQNSPGSAALSGSKVPPTPVKMKIETETHARACWLRRAPRACAWAAEAAVFTGRTCFSAFLLLQTRPTGSARDKTNMHGDRLNFNSVVCSS